MIEADTSLSIWVWGEKDTSIKCKSWLLTALDDVVVVSNRFIGDNILPVRLFDPNDILFGEYPFKSW